MSTHKQENPNDLVVKIKSKTVDLSARVKGKPASVSGRVKKLRLPLLVLFFILTLILIILSILNPEKWFAILKDFLPIIVTFLGMLKGK
jgi:uncharacterized membrane protein